MAPLYAARVGDLKLGDFVIAECACGIAGSFMWRGWRRSALALTIGSWTLLLGSGVASATRRATLSSR